MTTAITYRLPIAMPANYRTVLPHLIMYIEVIVRQLKCLKLEIRMSNA